jgi:hypothetical protein
MSARKSYLAKVLLKERAQYRQFATEVWWAVRSVRLLSLAWDSLKAQLSTSAIMITAVLGRVFRSVCAVAALLVLG